MNSVPAVTTEFADIAAEYVIVFLGTAVGVTPVVMLGMQANENVYLDLQNAWQATYVPAYVRRYPFVLSSPDGGKTLTLCIDESFPGFNREDRGEKLFDTNGMAAPFLDNVLKFLHDYQTEAHRTRHFCAAIEALRLLEPIRVGMTLPTGERVNVHGMMAVDRQRLRKLSGDVLARLSSENELEPIYLHLQSLRNIDKLKNRSSIGASRECAPSTKPSGSQSTAQIDGFVPARISGKRHGTFTGASTRVWDTRQSPAVGVSQSGRNDSPYNHDFIFGECGFDWLPDYIDRDLLFNVSCDLQSGEVKLYVLARSKDFIYKISRNSISKQYDAEAYGANPARLSEFLGARFDYDDLLLDTVEDDVYYMLIEDSSAPQYVRFLRALCVKFGVTEQRLVTTINKVNKRGIKNLEESCTYKAISLVKVPFLNIDCKIYSRPFLTGNGYELNENATAFLAKVYGCPKQDISAHLQHLWVAAELTSDRIVVSTQHHSLVHADSVQQGK